MRFAACRSLSIVFAVACVVLTLSASPASAQSAGVRAGVSAEPDQFFFGGHIETPPVADHLHFRPSAEVGVGHELTFVGFNFEFAYKFPTSRPWGLYAGGGPALNLIYTEAKDHAEGGLNLMVGVEHSQGFFAEFKVGMLDSPDVKLGVGYVLRRR